MSDNFISKFRSLLAYDSGFRLAARYQFFVSFSWDGTLAGSVSLNDIGYYIQDVEIPDIALHEDNDNDVSNEVGSYKGPGLNSKLQPSNKMFTLTFLDTEVPVIEKTFLPWIREVIRAANSNKYPFPRAHVYIDFFSCDGNSKLMTYKIKSAYPIFLETPKTSYKEGNSFKTRKVVFYCNDVIIEDLDGVSDTGDSTNTKEEKNIFEQATEDVKTSAKASDTTTTNKVTAPVDNGDIFASVDNPTTTEKTTVPETTNVNTSTNKTDTNYTVNQPNTTVEKVDTGTISKPDVSSTPTSTNTTTNNTTESSNPYIRAGKSFVNSISDYLKVSKE